MTKKTPQMQFKFKKHMSVGAMSAEEDNQFLSECFVDTGDLEVICSVDNPKSIILGRTGAGKSALIELIKAREDNVIELLPEDLSLNYISNSAILSFLESIGVNLDIFNQLLWRHILTVELLKKKYKIYNEENSQIFFGRLSDIFDRNEKKKQAVSYLRQWGDKFWLETDVRIKEITKKLEEDVQVGAKLGAYGLTTSINGHEKISQEQKEEIRNRAQDVVNKVQIQELNQVITLLSQDIFNDDQQKYYIVIDKLDDNWIDETKRYRLIRALIETIKKFRHIKPVKIILALRSDLLSRVFDRTRDAGFQEEKYEDLLLKLKWQKAQLQDLINKRISSLIRQMYTQNSAQFSDVFRKRSMKHMNIVELQNRLPISQCHQRENENRCKS